MSTPLRRPHRRAHADLPVGSADVLGRLAAAAWPHRAALRAGARSVTFAELDRDVSRLAFGLRQLLGGDGMPVVVSATPGVDFPAAFHAVLRSGNVAVPVNPRHAGRDVRAAAGDRAAVRRRCSPARCTSGSARCSTGHADLEQTLLLDAPATAGQLTCAELATRGGLLVEPRDRDENEVAVLHRRRAAHPPPAQGPRPGRRSTPTAWTRGRWCSTRPRPTGLTHLGAGLAAGATQVLYGNPDPDAAVREAERAGATHLCLPDDARPHTVLAPEAVAS